MKTKQPPSGAAIPLRVSDALKAKLEQAAKRLEISVADVIRLSAKIGLEDLKRINYDLAKLVVEKVREEEL